MRGVTSNLQVKLSNPRAHVSLDHRTSHITIQSRTEQALKVLGMTLFVFGDNHKCQLLASCKIEVTPLMSIYSQSQAGDENTITLSLPLANTDAKVQLFSSSPKQVYLPDDKAGNLFHLTKNSINYLSMHTKSFSPDPVKVVVNAIGKFA